MTSMILDPLQRRVKRDQIYTLNTPPDKLISVAIRRIALSLCQSTFEHFHRSLTYLVSSLSTPSPSAPQNQHVDRNHLDGRRTVRSWIALFVSGFVLPADVSLSDENGGVAKSGASCHAAWTNYPELGRSGGVKNVWRGKWAEERKDVGKQWRRM